jgi:hypothetical protein
MEAVSRLLHVPRRNDVGKLSAVLAPRDKDARAEDI